MNENNWIYTLHTSNGRTVFSREGNKDVQGKAVDKIKWLLDELVPDSEAPGDTTIGPKTFEKLVERLSSSDYVNNVTAEKKDYNPGKCQGLVIPGLGSVRISGPNINHVNGAIGEAHGLNEALANGEIVIQENGPVTETGPDYITYDPNNGGVINVYDSKFRSNGKFPNNVKGFGSEKWLNDTQAAINNIQDTALKKEVQDAFDNGRINWKMYKDSGAGSKIPEKVTPDETLPSEVSPGEITPTEEVFPEFPDLPFFFDL